MTGSKHTYTATVDGTAVVLHDDNPGSIGFDVSGSPHVRGQLRLASASTALLETLDARQSPPPRCVLEVDAVFPSGTQSRVFDLTVRGHERDQDTGAPMLMVASDEALLSDYRALTDDKTPLLFQGSLRDLVDYVLGTVIPGASLEPGPDVPVPALADSTNLVRNPRRADGAIWDWQSQATSGPLDDGGYLAGGPPHANSFFYFGAAGGTVVAPYHYYDEANLSVRGREHYAISVDVQVPTGVAAVVDAVFFDNSGNVVGYATPTNVTGASGVWQRKAVFATAPATGVRMRPRVLVPGNLTDGQYVNVTGWRVSARTGDDAADVLYFAGDSYDTTEYGYSFADEAWSSPSERTTLVDAAVPSALIWEAGQSAMEFLAPLVQRFGFRLVCDEHRDWSLRDAEYVAPGSTTIRYGVNMVAGSERVSRDDDVWCDSAVVEYEWTTLDGEQLRRLDTFTLGGSFPKVRRLQKQTPYPGPGFAEYVVRRAQGRGREVTATTVADWSALVEGLVAVRLDGSVEQVGTIQSLEFDLSRDEMTVNARTVEVGAHSISGLSGAINDLTGTINAL